MPGGGQRIDKWLVFARVVKSRSLAARLVQAGRVRRNRDKAQQTSDTVNVGDVLTITLDRRILVYRVLHAGLRRGTAEEARRLYEDLSPAASGEPAPPDEVAPLKAVPAARLTRRLRQSGQDGK